MNAIQMKKITKTDWLIAILSMFLAFFIDGSYRSSFRFDSEMIARTIGAAIAPTLFGWVLLIFFYRKLTRNLLWPYLIVMICAGFFAGVEAFALIRKLGMSIEEANKAMGVTIIVFMLISCLAYGIVCPIINILRNLFVTKKTINKY